MFKSVRTYTDATNYLVLLKNKLLVSKPWAFWGPYKLIKFDFLISGLLGDCGSELMEACEDAAVGAPCTSFSRHVGSVAGRGSRRKAAQLDCQRLWGSGAEHTGLRAISSVLLLSC